MIVDIAGNAVDLDLEPGDLVVDVVVLARVQRADDSGISGIIIGCTETTDDIVLNGMVRRAVQVVESNALMVTFEEDDDE